MAIAALSQPRPRLRRKSYRDFSLTGLIYTCMMLFMGMAAVNSQANLLFAVFGLMVGILLVSSFISRAVLRRLDVRRLLPEDAVVGRASTLQYEFRNRKRYLPSFSVTIGEIGCGDVFTKQPRAYLLHVAAGTATTVPTLVIPLRRGLHQLDRYQISTSFPFGFVRRALVRPHKEGILVHPPLARVDRRLLAMCLSAEQGDARMRPRRGGSDEFYGVKEFRSGENPRFIYWRRSARTGTLVSKEMTHVAPPRLLVLVDTFIAQRSLRDHAGVERAIAMAASLLAEALDQGVSAGLCAWAGRPVTISPGRGKQHRRDLLAILARLPLNVACERGRLMEAARPLLRNGTTPLLFTAENIEQSRGEQARGNWMILSSSAESAAQWFRFAPEVSFERCIPADQAPPAQG